MNNRRAFLKYSAGLSMASIACSPISFFGHADKKYQIGACDWSIGQHSMITALERGAKIGLDGIQVSMVNRNNDPHLTIEKIQNRYQEYITKTNVEIASFAIGQLNQVPFKEDPITMKWVSDGIDVAQAMGAPMILLAFFGKGDIKGDTEGIKEVKRRLKELAPKAEDKGVILGIESWLSAEEHMDIIDAVGSKNIKVYYDVANSHKMGYDIYKEIKWLGKSQICEFHLKENGFLLGKGRVDFERLKGVIEEIDYQGWLIIEGAIPEGAEIVDSYRYNCQYVNELFNT